MLVFEQIGQVGISARELGDDIGRVAEAVIGIEDGDIADLHGPPAFFGQRKGGFGGIEIERDIGRQRAPVDRAELGEALAGAVGAGAIGGVAAIREPGVECAALALVDAEIERIFREIGEQFLRDVGEQRRRRRVARRRAGADRRKAAAL